MSSPLASAGPQSPISHKTKRKRVRNATFILPSGERINRQITLRNHDHAVQGPSPAELGNALLPIHHASRYQFTRQNIRDTVTNSWTWANSNIGRSVLKCSFAYVLGSLAVFVPQVSNFLGQQDGKHMVATITCYFNPARSAGGMAEGALLGLAAFFYAAFIAIASMATSVVCDTVFNLIGLGYILVLVVFCGGGLGLIGWVKQKLNGPLVSVACSLASLAIITVLTKENAVQIAVFSNEKISQVLKMVILGMSTTTAVCLFIWPISARSELRQTMIKVTDSFGDMLTMITRSFLSGSEADLQSPQFEDTASRYKTVFNQLSKNLKEAKFEHYFLGTEDEYAIEKKLVECMRRLAQAVGGLRSAAATQFTLLNEKQVLGASSPMNARQFSIPQIHPSTILANVKIKQDRFAVLSAIDEVPDEIEDDELFSPILERSSSSFSFSGLPTVRSPSEIFERFILHLGPSVKSLAYTLSQILQELPFGEKPDFKIVTNEHFTTSLEDALHLYANARAQALRELYKSKELSKDRPESIEADFEEVAASCGHFSFSLQDIAEEMQNYLSILSQLKEEVERPNRRSWKWLVFWRKKSRKFRRQSDDPEREPLIHHNAVETYQAQELPDIKLNDRKYKPYDTPKPRSFRKWLLDITRVLRKDDVRFPIKVGLGAALWAMFAFIPETRPFYRQWRGEWGLISYMLVCSMTVGASNTTGIGRFLGTALGAIIAIVVWILCQGNPYALVVMGWLVSLPCFYIIVALNKGPMGRFILLTYNLSCLYAYSLSVKEGVGDEDEGGVNPIITEIALHRVVATMGGCLWGLVVTRVIWPISAQRKFKDGLSILWLRMGLIWKRDPLSVLLEEKEHFPKHSNTYMDLCEEYALQKYVSKLENLRGSAASEFELRGPFREKQYGRIVASTSRMLDAFHAMNVIMMKDVKASEGEIAILRYTADERAELCKRISHLFQVMASSMKLEFPLNDAVPSTSNARDRLLAKIFHFRKTETAEKVKDEDYALLYAFALVTGQLGEEITRVGAEVEGLFGVLNEEVLELR